MCKKTRQKTGLAGRGGRSFAALARGSTPWTMLSISTDLQDSARPQAAARAVSDRSGQGFRVLFW
ncbi:hypothetical protein CQW49_13585 [Methylosinus trichosporium OB3b]|uniref:Uncharacterized protein n=1 Tax=Methylosinus trichosporium (strain ATCC 35070 / NCIMB 11131 / UNIQEM 75 / OB3b) TaxID=595536 RepID=A0A2D2D1D2_METT3|nr:hypothetical protein CQW49_13585 [Methylosinus trichosporium OB3b]OBS51656.1 hypothetical protein A8B73_15110 [Methylosinus sp. 3S-1]